MMNFVEDPNVTLIPGLCAAEVVTKNMREPAPTYWVHVARQSDNPPREFLDALAAAGFAEDEEFASAPPLPWQGVNLQFLDLSKAGGGDFQGWTEEEGRANMASLRAIFKRFGVPFVRREVTLAEML